MNVTRPDLLPATIPFAALVLMALGATVVWLLAHRAVSARQATIRLAYRFAITVPVAIVTSWCVFQAAGRVLSFSASWHLWTAAAFSGILIQGVILLYEHEAALVSRATARLLVALRLLAIGTTVFILLQPAWMRHRSRTINRRVAVLLDDSASMARSETQWTTRERIDAAQGLGAIAAKERALHMSVPDTAAFRSNLVLWRQLAENAAVPPEPRDLLSACERQQAILIAQTNTLARILAAADGGHKAQCGTLGELLALLQTSVAPAFTNAVAQFRHAAPGDATRDARLAQLKALEDAVTGWHAALPAAAEAADMIFWDGLPDERRQAITDRLATNRTSIAADLLQGQPAGRSGLLAKLRSRYTVELTRFGDASATDFTRALEESLNDIPSEELAGVLFLTDGRHTGAAGVDAVSRRFDQARAPICTILIGGTQPLFDLAIASVRVNESIFLGDSVRATVSLIATGAKGREAVVRLFCGEEKVAEEKVAISSDAWSHDVRLTDIPTAQGIHRYRIVAETLEGESLAENNTWNLEVSVSDDRTNVLLVDRRPRWEYRYLRNLFYGRDKSVHLQYVLTHPDTVSGYALTNLPPASASRDFGDAEASAVPSSREEWRKFDVIILGDIGEEVLTPDVVADIRHCVEVRGAMLVVISGPEAMPYGITSTTFRDLLPVSYQPLAEPWRVSPDPAGYRLTLTPAGRAHALMHLSSSITENEVLWNELPDFQWRLTVDDVKPGAEVLAYALPVPAPGREPAAPAIAPPVGAAVDDLLRHLEELRKFQARNALVVTRHLGRGKVLMLTFDRTWRLRYRVGDTLHHRFWGEAMRWGIGEKLRAGNLFVRLGSDALSYLPGQSVRIMSRLTDETFTPINDADIEGVLSKDGKAINRIRLRYREESNGLYEATLPPLGDLGSYTLSLRTGDPRVARVSETLPETQFLVVASLRPAENIYATADWTLPRRMADLSGGLALTPADTGRLLTAFGEGSRTIDERVEFALWDSWLFFLILVVLLTAEWLLRKNASLP